MHTRKQPAILVRPLRLADRPAVADIVARVGNFNAAETACALELVDTSLQGGEDNDYQLAVAEDSTLRVRAYVCWGPTPLTRGTYDLYWIATDPEIHGQGFGRALMEYVEERLQEESARLLVVETSSKESYASTVRFYRRLGYEELSRIRDFYDVGDDKLILVKRFSR